MLIDQTETGRELFRSEGAYPTHEGADAIFTTLADKMDAYSRRYAEYAEPAWEREFGGARERKSRGCGKG
jgi:hypothetical protein